MIEVTQTQYDAHIVSLTNPTEVELDAYCGFEAIETYDNQVKEAVKITNQTTGEVKYNIKS